MSDITDWDGLALPNLAHVEHPEGASLLVDAGAIEQFKGLGYEVVDPQVTPPLEDPFEVKGKRVTATKPDDVEDPLVRSMMAGG
jgi:hypothetical protein